MYLGPASRARVLPLLALADIQTDRGTKAKTGKFEVYSRFGTTWSTNPYPRVGRTVVEAIGMDC